MSTQVDEDVDIESWLDAEAEDADPCGTIHMGVKCDKEAVFRISWRADDRWGDQVPTCGCGIRSALACLEHGERYMGMVVNRELVFCRRCEGLMLAFNFDRIER